MSRVVIVGAGPAGIAAAKALLENELAPILIDEAALPGGQIYRAPDPGTGLDLAKVLGRDMAAFERFHNEAAAVTGRIDWRPRTSAWAVHDGALWTARDGGIEAVPYDALVLATGATDRTLPVPGWTLPGVYTLGGAQVLLKSQGCLIGRRVLFCGSSPLLYLAAKQYFAAGAAVAAILDTTPFPAKVGAAAGLARVPETLLRGLGHMARVRLEGVQIRHGVRLVAFEGRDELTAVRYQDARGRERSIACDGAAYGFGLEPETQLADLARIRFRFDAVFRQWLPAADLDGRASTTVYLAGDGATIGGAEAAAISGTLAAAALLEDRGRAPSSIDRAALRRRLERLRRFQHGLARAFAWPGGELARIDQHAMVCRCEAIGARVLHDALAQPLPPADVNRLKALTRVGMGRCQGRFCGLAAAEIMASCSGRPLEAVGRLRGQAPVKPLPPAAAEGAPP
jgi:NADPH-dependent 2,4-dienoyl-CoA reductase/sulfur reductase-like enzyme